MNKSENIFNLVPSPRICTKKGGTCALSATARIKADSVFADECAVFIKEMNTHGYGFSLIEACAKNDEPVCAPLIGVCTDEAISSTEGYALGIAPDAVTVFARTKTGAFYGLQTLRQILLTARQTHGAPDASGVMNDVSNATADASHNAPDACTDFDASFGAPDASCVTYDASNATADASAHRSAAASKECIPHTQNTFVLLPCAFIQDEPYYEWRGFMLDTARTFYSVGFIKKLLDVAALHKLNRFHWHLTDDQGWRLPVDAYPNLTKIGSVRVDSRFEQTPIPVHHDWFYTHDQIRDVVAYAAARHITVVPEIETPGHASALLAAYPHLGCTGGPYRTEIRYGIFDDVLCCGNDEVLTVLDEVIKTVAELFPGKYIHIGGDECPRTRWAACPKCQARVQSEHLRGTEQLQPWITSRVAAIVAKYGKTPIGWDEVLDGMDESTIAPKAESSINIESSPKADASVPNVTLTLPRDLIVMSWRGYNGGVKAASQERRVIMTPTTDGCYLDYPHLLDGEEPGSMSVTTVKNSYDYSPVPNGFPHEKEPFVLGGQGNLWSERLPESRWAEYMMFPRLCALSEALWLPKCEKDFASFSKRLYTHKTRLAALNVLYYNGPLQ